MNDLYFKRLGFGDKTLSVSQTFKTLLTQYRNNGGHFNARGKVFGALCHFQSVRYALAHPNTTLVFYGMQLNRGRYYNAHSIVLDKEHNIVFDSNQHTLPIGKTEPTVDEGFGKYTVSSGVPDSYFAGSKKAANLLMAFKSKDIIDLFHYMKSVPEDKFEEELVYKLTAMKPSLL